MMNKDNAESLESLLLDLHLKRLDPGQAEVVEDAIAHSPELATQSQSLRQLLGLLDRYEIPEPPANLAESVLARINGQPAVIPFPQAAVSLPNGNTHELSSSPVLSLRELIAIAACITLFIGVFVPGYYRARNIASRQQCRTNMAQIFGGMATYAAANDDSLPFAGFVQDGYWTPQRIAGVRRASNTRPVYLLVRERYIADPRAFICPSAPDGRPMLVEDPDDYKDFHDFAEQANNSYSFVFSNSEEPARLEIIRGDDGRMVLVGDRNPLFDGRAVHRVNPYDEESFNSPTHENGAGQNVLYATGQVGWFTTPLVGVNRDNIYRAGQIARYLGNERPSYPTDSFIIP
jgi:hypothetical protein